MDMSHVKIDTFFTSPFFQSYNEMRNRIIFFLQIPWRHFLDGGYQDISALGDPCGFHTLNKQFSKSIFIIGIGVNRTGVLTLQF